MPRYDLPRAEWEPIATTLRMADTDGPLVPTRYQEALLMIGSVTGVPGLTDHEKVRRVSLILVAFGHVNAVTEGVEQ